MEISSSLLLEQPAENEVLVTQHLLQLSLLLWGKAPRLPPYFPIPVRFSLPNSALIYPAAIRQQCQLRDATLEDTRGRLSIPKGSPATALEGPAVLHRDGIQAGTVPQGTAWQPHPRDGLCARPSYAPGMLQNWAAPRPCASCCQEESLACADSFLSALKIILD